MTMQAPPPPAPPAAAPPAPPAAPPAAGAAPAAGPVAALTMASQKLAAVLAAAQAAGGALPANAAAELAQVVQAVQGATGGAAPPAAGAPPPPAAGPPKPPAPPGGAPPFGKADSGDVQKELDAYTEMKVTLDAARERMWGVSDAIRDGEMDTAKSELKGVIAMLSGLKGDTMKSTSEVPMTKALFASWTAAQFEAMTKDEPEVAVARLSTVKRVTAIAKVNWEKTGSDGTAPFTVEMETAFAPEKEKTQDLTTKTDQSEKETPAAKDKVDGTGSFAQNLSEVVKDVQSALTVTEQSGSGAFANSAPTFAHGAGKTEKAEPTKKSDPNAPFVWPMDMSAPETGEDFNKDIEPTKRPADEVDGWGKDPWAGK